MATQNRYEDQGFKLYRKSNTGRMPIVTYSQYDGTCYEDDGYEDTDALAVVAMLKHQIDQGQGAYFSEINGWSRSSGQQPVSQETHDKWLNAPAPENDYYLQKKAEQKKAEPKVDVTRTVPKIMDTPKPVIPKWYTVAEDCQEVERWIAIIESVDNMEIIRTPESVRRIAKWIRQDEHSHYRSKRPISCDQVRGILKEFEK